MDGNKIRIADKIYPYWKSREIEGTIKTLTMKRTFRGYYIYLVCEQEVSLPKEVTSGNRVGFDFGMKTFLTASDGNDINIPLFLKINLNRLKRKSKLNAFLRHEAYKHYSPIQLDREGSRLRSRHRSRKSRHTSF